MPNRKQNAATAAQTVVIAHAGHYATPAGRTVSIADAVQLAVENSYLITPSQSRSLHTRAAQALASHSFATTFDVTNQTTLAAARRLVDCVGEGRVAALNFASAKNPGGGFLGGSQAQEESLARATALYPCLLRHPTYYDANRHAPSALYTDHLIVAPRVPVFRDDDDQLLDDPWEVTILTSPAPNAGALAKNRPDLLSNLESTFRRRIDQLLAAAVIAAQTALVLGAWGCGVFRNDPHLVAQLFAEHLLSPGPYAHAFEHVTFAILDSDGETIAPFAQRFAPASP